MTYDSNDFVITPETQEGNVNRYAKLIAHNRSSIAIKSIETTYNTVDYKGVVTDRSSLLQEDMAPGEKRVIINASLLSKEQGIIVTDITVTAADGTKFKVPLPPMIKVLNTSCFVTTAAYGDAHHPMVETYRNFRDDVLINYKTGRTFINWYYNNGPALSDMIKDRPRICAITRIILTPPAIIINVVKSITNCIILHNNNIK